MRAHSLHAAIILLVFQTLASAAPHPATSSSLLISSDLGLFISPQGFSIHAGKTNWIQTTPPHYLSSIATLYRSPNTNQGVQPSLTVRVDEVQDLPTLHTYVHRWLKDYRRLGFDVLINKPVTINGQPAYMVDVLNRDSEKQLRQVVLIKSNTAVILTCRDHRQTFLETSKHCTEIMRNFRWSSR